MKNIVNLTPHDIVVIVDGGQSVFPASGVVARVTTKSLDNGNINGIPVVHTIYGDVDFGGLDIDKDTVYIVSGMVLSALKATDHPFMWCFVSPNTDMAIRNDEGQIIGVPGFKI